MSKAGKTILLALLILLGSGVITKSFAQEQFKLSALGNTPKGNVCSPLESILVTKNNTCEYQSLSQVEKAVKAQVKEEDPKPNKFSYATEPTYYIPPVETPTPTVAPAINNTQTNPNTLQQEPKDLLPAIGPNLDSNLIFDLINAHRTSIGKAPFLKDDALCSLAIERSNELFGELFEGKGYLHSGLYNRNLPYWITENAKWGSNEAGTVVWWLNSPIHRRAIEGDYTYSCGACNGSQCSQLFTSFCPKSVCFNR